MQHIKKSKNVKAFSIFIAMNIYGVTSHIKQDWYIEMEFWIEYYIIVVKENAHSILQSCIEVFNYNMCK